MPGLKAANIIAACEGSLKRLKTDYIDLYQSHADDESDTPQDETLEAFGRLIAAGKVRAIGASNFGADAAGGGAEKIAEEGGLPRYDTLQPLYNLVERDFEKALQPLCVEQEIGVIPFYALAAGFLTGKYRSKADAEGKARGRPRAAISDCRKIWPCWTAWTKWPRRAAPPGGNRHRLAARPAVGGGADRQRHQPGPTAIADPRRVARL